MATLHLCETGDCRTSSHSLGHSPLLGPSPFGVLCALRWPLAHLSPHSCYPLLHLSPHFHYPLSHLSPHYCYPLSPTHLLATCITPVHHLHWHSLIFGLHLSGPPQLDHFT